MRCKMRFIVTLRVSIHMFLALLFDLRGHMAACEEELKGARRPFRQIPAVVEWQQEHAAVSSRKKLLVLNGRSRTGKTVYAVSLAGAGRGLELNCSGVLDPPLRDFQHDLHDLVLFDEASPKMVLKYKKLFQCPNALVQIGFSATNMFSYSVYMHRCLLVIASNTWRSELSALLAEDREWLESNQVLVDVHEPLYL